MASKILAYLAKLVCKKLGSRMFRNPPAPAPYAQNAIQRKSGETPNAIQNLEMKSKDGPAVTAGADSQTLKMLQNQEVRLNALKAFNQSH